MNEITSKEYDIPDSYGELVTAVREMYIKFNEDIYKSLKDRIEEVENDGVNVFAIKPKTICPHCRRMLSANELEQIKRV